MKPERSFDFLMGLVTEYSEERYGPYTKEAIKDWVSDNEPVTK